MKGEHVAFADLSDYHDGEMTDAAARARIEGHLASCRDCAEEYRRLTKTVRLCKAVGKSLIPVPTFSVRTVERIRARSRRRLALRSLPAIAASLFVVIGVGLYLSGSFGAKRTDGIRASYSESERVIDIIRKHRATIRQVTEQYVEGRVSLEHFRDLRRSLGGRRVAYLPVSEHDVEAGLRWDSAVEEVGLVDPLLGDAAVERREKPSGTVFVLFRVYR